MKTYFAFIILGMVFFLGIAACAKQPTSPGAQDSSAVPGEPSGAPPEPSTAAEGNLTTAANGTPAIETTLITMEAKDWEFIPDDIVVKVGDHILIKAKSTDVMPGFALPDYGISQELPPGEDVLISFIADKPGTFEFRCNVPCGEGHREMTGTLVVEPT